MPNSALIEQVPDASVSLAALAAELESTRTDTPELTILVPTLNEELTVGAFLDWCREGIERTGVKAEIIIVDSSQDKTSEIATEKGARVVDAPKRGLGRAYQVGIARVRGKYVLMGDADCTYDFRELQAFLDRLREGNEFVMGSRFRGYIEAGSMPGLHRYFGTPLTTWILNILYGTRFSDIHCGMRGITKEALTRMQLESDGWQYASEMVLKSVHMKLRTAEVPVRFYKDPEGRESHHKRSGWMSPWKAGWSNLEVMLTHGAEFFTIKPGLAILVVGLIMTLPLAFGPVHLGHYVFSLYSMLLGLTLSVLGMQMFGLGCITQLLHDYSGEASRRWLRVFRYNRSVLCSAGLLLAGLAMLTPLGAEYWNMGFTLEREVGRSNHMAIVGLLLVIVAFANFVFTLVLHSAAFRVDRRHAIHNI
jgi:glycosyltransferase involved in cell wall biosynthesis